MPALPAVDRSFVHDAPENVVVEQVVRASPAHIWSAICDNESWVAWYPDVARCDATSTPATGVGATRTTKIGALVAAERFVVWEPDSMLAFTVTRTNLPMAKRMLEQIEIEGADTGPSGSPRSNVRYTGSFEPYLLTRLTFRFTKRLVRRSWEAGLAGLAAHVESTPK